MTQTFSLLGFVAHLATVERDMHELGPAIVARACELVCEEAKRVLGTYDYGWTPLAPSTLARKMMNTPLLETGELRASIEWNSTGNQGFVGSNSDKALWHEFGTARIPPRPFLAGAAMAMEDKIHKMAARAVMAVMLGQGLHSVEMRELLHLLHRAAHHVKEDIEEMLPKDEDKNNKGRHR
jgi:phage gpG-like protein